MATPKTLQQAILFFSDYANCHRAVMEIRWPDGVVRCPHCGSENVTYMESVRRWKCYAKHAKPQFSLKVGTIFEDSAVGLEKWLPALWLVTNCKNGISSYELARALEVTQKTAWFMLSRLRLALHDDPSDRFSGHIEADETFIGGKARNMHKGKRKRVIGWNRGRAGKVAVAGLLERTSPDGHSRVRTHIPNNLRRFALQSELRKNVKMDGESTVYTDALKSYEQTTKWGPTDLYIHKVIDHGVKYADGVVHTNGI
jgi:transposase-like protein